MPIHKSYPQVRRLGEDIVTDNPDGSSVLQYNASSGTWKDVLPEEAYVPISLITSHDAPGIKGQWSYGIASWHGDESPVYWVCIANSTWVDLPDREWAQALLDLKLDTSVFEDAFTEGFVPEANIVDQDSEGVKGQWSFGSGYLYFCIGRDTWVRHAVETSFTV